MRAVSPAIARIEACFISISSCSRLVGDVQANHVVARRPEREVLARGDVGAGTLQSFGIKSAPAVQPLVQVATRDADTRTLRTQVAMREGLTEVPTRGDLSQLDEVGRLGESARSVVEAQCDRASLIGDRRAEIVQPAATLD